MTERTKLLKKAVLTSVGATTSVDRIKSALGEVMQDLVKVGQELLGELESKGRTQTESASDFLKRFQKEASKRTAAVEKKVSQKVHTGVKKAANEFGLATYDQVEEILDRLSELEVLAGVSTKGGHNGSRKRGRRRRASRT